MFDVYNLLDIEPVKAEKAYFWDRDGNKYLDFYGGHAVISIGHSHPHYVELVTGQLNRIGFYSNAVKNHCRRSWSGNYGSFPVARIIICSFVIAGRRLTRMP